ncbi:hypothetical protein M8J76_016632 [Diaphorina citri]|nr:hypothetical protein M8J75_007601 [Diaphorina citri]KAI5750557.1 hypothetical protein M8J76_016632 [Diaphorina citri]
MFSITKYRRKVHPIFKCFMKNTASQSMAPVNNPTHRSFHCICPQSTFSIFRQLKTNSKKIEESSLATSIAQSFQNQTGAGDNWRYQLLRRIKDGDVDGAVKCLEGMNKRGVPVRCHYFWPLIIQMHHQYGEIGVLDILDKMLALGSTPDHETLIHYICPRLDLTNSVLAIRKLQDRDLKVAQLLTPVCVCLLQCNQIEPVLDLCFTLFPRTKLLHEDFIFALVDYYINSNDKDNTVKLLKRADSISDVGNLFLTRISQSKNPLLKVENVQVIITEFIKNGIDFSQGAVYDLKVYFAKHKLSTSDFVFYQKTSQRIPARLDVDRSAPSLSEMSTADLECHLISLKSRDSNPTSTLKRLLLKYCQEKRFDEAMRVKDELHRLNAEFTPGMLSSCIDILIHFNLADEAYNMLTHLRHTAPDFHIDEYKVIDLARVCVQQDQFQNAITLVSSISPRRNLNFKKLERNCRELLSCVQSEEQLMSLFNILCETKLCDVTSTPILSTVIRYFLNGQQYRRTPLKHELLVSCLNQNKHQQLYLVRNVDTKIHGEASSAVAYITALAEVNQADTLRTYVQSKLTITPQFIQTLVKQIRRLSDENKIHSLTVLKDVFPTHLDLVDHIFMGLLRIYCRKNASKEINQLKEEYEKIKTPSPEFANIIRSRSNINPPSSS